MKLLLLIAVLLANDPVGQEVPDFRITNEASIICDPAKALTKSELSADLRVLSAALDSMYIGQAIYPERVVSFLQSLKPIEGREGLTTHELGTHLAEHARGLQDQHLAILATTKDSVRRIHAPGRKAQRGSVGSNIAAKSESFWLSKTVSVGNQPVDVLGITTAAIPYSHPDWPRVYAFVRDSIKSETALVIDLRGNSGGYTDRLYVIARLLYGLPSNVDPPDPKSKWTGHTGVAAQQALANSNLLSALEAERSGLSGALERQIVSDRLEKIQKEKPGTVVSVHAYNSSTFDWGKLARIPVRILTDKENASAVELFLECMEASGFRTIGERTMGCVTFGGMSSILLPNSRLIVRLSTRTFSYKDGRNVEWIGYSPVIEVSPGSDALDVALRDIESERKQRAQDELERSRRFEEDETIRSDAKTEGPLDVKKADEMFRAANKLHAEKNYKDAINLLKRIFYQLPNRSVGYNSAYNVACAYALTGEQVKALDWLEEACKAGFSNAGHVGKDPDLNSLKNEPRFKRILGLPVPRAEHK